MGPTQNSQDPTQGAQDASEADAGQSEQVGVTVVSNGDGTFTVAMIGGDSDADPGDDSGADQGTDASGASNASDDGSGGDDSSDDGSQSATADNIDDAMGMAKQMLSAALGGDSGDSDDSQDANAQMDPATATAYWRQLSAKKKRESSQ